MTISLFSSLKTEASEKLSFFLDITESFLYNLWINIIWCICRFSVVLINVALTNNRKELSLVLNGLHTVKPLYAPYRNKVFLNIESFSLHLIIVWISVSIH